MNRSWSCTPGYDERIVAAIKKNNSKVCYGSRVHWRYAISNEPRYDGEIGSEFSDEWRMGNKSTAKGTNSEYASLNSSIELKGEEV